MFANSGQVIGSISAVPLSFIVHEPSGIIDWHSDRSRDSSRLMYRSISCSAWKLLNTGCVRYVLVRANGAGYTIAAAPASSSTEAETGCLPAKISQSVATSSRVEFSSSDTPSVPSP